MILTVGFLFLGGWSICSLPTVILQALGGKIAAHGVWRTPVHMLQYGVNPFCLQTGLLIWADLVIPFKSKTFTSLIVFCHPCMSLLPLFINNSCGDDSQVFLESICPSCEGVQLRTSVFSSKNIIWTWNKELTFLVGHVLCSSAWLGDVFCSRGHWEEEDPLCCASPFCSK